MMKINEIWKELESDSSVDHGLLLRRYSKEIILDVYVAIHVPQKSLCVAFSFLNSTEIKFDAYNNLSEIQIEVIPDRHNQEKKYLIIKLLKNHHRDIFAVLCEDLLASSVNFKEEEKLVKSVLNRFEKWKSLFDRMVSQGLTPEEQRGLYGELLLLKKLLMHNFDKVKTLDSWVGPSGEIRDFQYLDWAVEVKTSSGNNHQKVQISSERQLDIRHLKTLFLYHISLEKSNEGGETLISIIESISKILRDNYLALNKFFAKLYEYGCFEIHYENYLKTGYHIRKDNFYLVDENFPRIEESDLRIGVGDVNYSIILSHCSGFVQDEESVFNKIFIQ